MAVIPETRMNGDVKCFLIGDIHYFDGKEKKEKRLRENKGKVCWSFEVDRFTYSLEMKWPSRQRWSKNLGLFP